MNINDLIKKEYKNWTSLRNIQYYKRNEKVRNKLIELETYHYKKYLFYIEIRKRMVNINGKDKTL